MSGAAAAAAGGGGGSSSKQEGGGSKHTGAAAAAAPGRTWKHQDHCAKQQDNVCVGKPSPGGLPASANHSCDSKQHVSQEQQQVVVAAAARASRAGGSSSRRHWVGRSSRRRQEAAAAAARAAAPGRGQKEERMRILCVGEQCDRFIAIPSAPADNAMSESKKEKTATILQPVWQLEQYASTLRSHK